MERKRARVATTLAYVILRRSRMNTSASDPRLSCRERHHDAVTDVIEPFDMSGVVRGDDGVKQFESLPSSLVEMLRASTDEAPDAEAFVELDGPRPTYSELWDAAARVAGGLREGGVRRGHRVAVRHGNGLDWALSFLGTLLAGGVAVPVNTRFTESEVDYV